MDSGLGSFPDWAAAVHTRRQLPIHQPMEDTARAEAEEAGQYHRVLAAASAAAVGATGTIARPSIRQMAELVAAAAEFLATISNRTAEPDASSLKGSHNEQLCTDSRHISG